MTRDKRNKIIYWVATLWLSLGMLSTGIVQLLTIEEEVNFILELGYPTYLLGLLGISKLLGIAAILLPNLNLLKEWAYAGFVFMMTLAIYSHLSVGKAEDIYPALLLLVLTLISYLFRPENRKLTIPRNI